MENIKRKLIAILSADVKDYSLLMQDDEAATVQTLNEYKVIMERLILQHHGRVVDSPGDNLLAEFSSVVDATQGAVAIQRELKDRNDALPRNRRMVFRMGINLGDVICEEGRIFGDGVNIAARLEGLSDPGGICISRTAYDQIVDKLPFGYEDLGERQVKNADRPIRAYRVILWPEARGIKNLFGRPGGKNKEETEAASGVTPPDAGQESARSGRPSDRRARLKAKIRERVRARFAFHLKAYLGLVGFLAAINIFSYAGVIWFHWAALGWGILLYLHWLRVSSVR